MRHCCKPRPPKKLPFEQSPLRSFFRLDQYRLKYWANIGPNVQMSSIKLGLESWVEIFDRKKTSVCYKNENLGNSVWKCFFPIWFRKKTFFMRKLRKSKDSLVLVPIPFFGRIHASKIRSWNWKPLPSPKSRCCCQHFNRFSSFKPHFIILLYLLLVRLLICLIH